MRTRNYFLILWLISGHCLVSTAAESAHSPTAVARFIDQQMAAMWRSQELVPSEVCADHEYLRRVCLDVAGVIPTEHAVTQFLQDRADDKRVTAVETLLKTQTYARYSAATWANLWIGRGKDADALIHARFREWLFLQIRANKPFDRIVTEILTATGTPVETPAVAWTLHHAAKPENLAANSARLFLGRQMQCAQCHDHPFEPITQEDFYHFAAFFARTKVQPFLISKRASETSSGEMHLGGVPTGQVIAPRFMDGTTPSAAGTRRQQLAAWITHPDHRNFSRAITNRVWARLFGRGLVDPVDDLNPRQTPDFPKVLDRLADEFIYSGYDLQYLIRTITRTRVYQLSSQPSRNNRGDERFFSKARLRRLNPEQLVGSVVMSTGLASSEQAWQNPIFRLLLQVVVQDFTFVFGNMDETTEVSEFRGTIAQALMMMNSKHMTNATRFHLLSPLTQKLQRCRSVNEKIELLFRTTLSRRPTTAELRTFGSYFRAAPQTSRQLEVCEDLYWALLNCNEFHFNY